MIPVGKIVKPHGIGGEVKIIVFTDSPASFAKIKKFYVKNTYKTPEKIRVSQDYVLVKLEGVDSMNAAELFRNEIVYCDREFLPKLEKGRFYIDDVIGCLIYVDDVAIGIVSDVLQYGSADVVVFRTNDKHTGMFPWVKELDATIDAKNKVFCCDRKRFDEVVSYDF